jgi:hypothetical protein
LNKEDEEAREKEIESVLQIILQAIPTGVHITSIIIALTRLAGHFTWELSEDDDGDEDGDDYEDGSDSPFGTISGTSFSKN